MTFRRFAAVVVCFLLVISACSGDDADQTTTSTTLRPASTTSSTATTAPPATTSTSSAPAPTSTPVTTTPGLAPVSELASGLFCRDLFPLGYGYADAVAYWLLEGSPDRMDADRNDIPCETVYSAADVAAYWGAASAWGTLPWSSLAGIAYANDVPSALQATLAREGFVIDDTDSWPHMGYIYESLYQYAGRPLFVTTDAAFHHWHLVFDKILRDTEEKELLPVLERFIETFVEEAREQTSELSGTALAEAALRVEEHLEAIATVLGLDVGPIGTRAAEEVALVNAHTEFRASPTVGGICDIPESLSGCVDYSRNTPRGHYTRTENLTRYFKAMSMLGNTGFGLDQPDPFVVGLLLSRLLVSERILSEDWTKIYEPTAVLVGAADDYTPLEAAAAADGVSVGWRANPEVLTDRATVRRIADALEDTRPVEINPNTASIRSMGVRWILDSYILDQLAYPNVDEPDARGRVSPLDVAGALGSEWALDRLHEIDPLTLGADYERSLIALRARVADRDDDDWSATVYDSWLWALVPSFLPEDNQRPPFMRTDSWTAKSHQSGLGSYTELKHDTILYGKEGMAEGGAEPPPLLLHWVEPDPVTFGRIADTAVLLRRALDDQGLLPPETDDFYSLRAILDDFIEIVDRLTDIAQDELTEGRPNEADSEWLGWIGSSLAQLMVRTGQDGTHDPYGGLVADVFLDLFSNSVLELGTGEFDRIHVIVPDGDGGFQVASGAVYSYYEFWHPRSDRLTDEQWWDMIEKEALPDRPVWVAEYLGL